jgi:beta-lactam-binding protein with PASTA domain
MSRVKPVGSRPADPPPPGDVPPAEPSRWKQPFRLTVGRWRLPKGGNWFVYLLIGVAVFAVAGYLVAALVLFPSPMLANERAVGLVIGLTERDAARELEKAGLRDSVAAREEYPGAAAGTVTWQDPPPGVAVPRGSLVTLIISTGEPRVAVPDVRGYDNDIAQQILAAAGLRVDGVDSVETKDAPTGMAGSTTPAAGERLPIGRTVTLHLAR